MSFLTRLLGRTPGNPTKSVDGDNRPAPHVVTFASVFNSIAGTYSYRSDEALKNSHENALSMRRDCFIRSLIQERFIPTSRRKWKLEVDTPRDPFQRQVKEGLTASIKGIKRFNRMRRYLSAGAGWHGRYGAQGTWQRDSNVKDTKTGSPLWVFRHHQPVNGDKIQYQWDGTPAVMINSAMAGFPRDSIITGDRAPLLLLNRPEWRRDFVIHLHDVEDADYFEGDMAGRVNGVGLRDYMYWCWWMRDECLSWALDFMQKVGTMGLLVFWYEESNKEAKKQQEANAKAASTRTALVMPLPGGKEAKTMGVDQIAPQTGGVEALLNIISEYFERHMERIAVGQSMSSGADNDSGLGGTGRADFAKDTKFQILASDAESLDETLTDDLVDVAKLLNYPWADFPVRFKAIVPDPEKSDKLKTTLELITNPKIAQKVALNDVLEMGDIREADEGEETIGDAPLGGVLGDPDAIADDKPLGGVLGNTAATNGKPLGGVLGTQTYADASGHEHKPAGPGGGQFTAGGTGDAAAPDAKPAKKKKGPKSAKGRIKAAEKRARNAQRLWRDAHRSGDQKATKRLLHASYLWNLAAKHHEDGNPEKAAIAEKLADDYETGKRHPGDHVDTHAASLEVESYDAGRWITIGGKKGEGGRSGGSPVFIENGRITKGAPSLVGKKPGEMKGEAEHGTHRKQLAQSRDYDRAKNRKQSKEAGHNSDHVENLASEIKAHHDALANDRRQLLKRARDHHRSNGFGELKNLAARSAGGSIDANSIKHFDQTAEAMQAAYPHLFRPETGEHGDHGDQLFEMLSAGDPQPMHPNDAHEQALDQFERMKHEGHVPEPDYPAAWDDVEPFAARVPVETYAATIEPPAKSWLHRLGARRDQVMHEALGIDVKVDVDVVKELAKKRIAASA